MKSLQHSIFKYINQAASNLHVSAYVVGGYVRDFYLQRGTHTDIDITVVGSGIDLAHEVAKLLKNNSKIQVFKTYGTAMLKYKDLQIEFVGARKESYHENSRNPNVSIGTLQDDLDRRDFTINAMAFSLNSNDYGTLLDPFNGQNDLANQIIKTPLNPDITFSDDPLRMLRAIRFASQLHFTIELKSLLSITKNAERIKIITEERIVAELNKIMLSSKPSIGLKLLEETGLFQLILPELTALKGIDEIDGERHKDNFYHTLEVVDNIAQSTDNLWLRWAALLHDIGKTPTKKFDSKIGWTFHNHEFIGSKMVFKIFKRLKMPLNETVKYVQKMVMMHARPLLL